MYRRVVDSYASCRQVFVVSVVILYASLLGSCGGGGSLGGAQSLTVSPAGEMITYRVGPPNVLIIGASEFQVLLNGSPVAPANVSWTSTSACINVQANFPHCNPGCAAITNAGGNSVSATVTASANGQTASATVTCQYTQ